MRKDVIKRVIYRYGYHQVYAEVMRIQAKDVTSEEKRKELEELFGSEIDLSAVQFRSWYVKFKSEEQKESPHYINRLVRELDIPLRTFLNREYHELKKPARKIAEELNERYGYNLNGDYVRNWFERCDIKTRTAKEMANLRWEDPDEVEKARQKTLAYFKTPEGEKRKVELSEWNAKVWGKKYSTSKLEVRFAEEFLDGIDHHYQKQFRLENQKLIVADFFINGRVVEINGDYWHAHPKKYSEVQDTRVLHRLERDKIKHHYYTENNLPVIYIWENDIKRNPELVEKYLSDFLDGIEVPLNSYDYH